MGDNPKVTEHIGYKVSQDLGVQIPNLLIIHMQNWDSFYQWGNSEAQESNVGRGQGTKCQSAALISPSMNLVTSSK